MRSYFDQVNGSFKVAVAEALELGISADKVQSEITQIELSLKQIEETRKEQEAAKEATKKEDVTGENPFVTEKNKDESEPEAGSPVTPCLAPNKMLGRTGSTEETQHSPKEKAVGLVEQATKGLGSKVRSNVNLKSLLRPATKSLHRHDQVSKEQTDWPLSLNVPVLTKHRSSSVDLSKLQ